MSTSSSVTQSKASSAQSSKQKSSKSNKSTQSEKSSHASVNPEWTKRLDKAYSYYSKADDKSAKGDKQKHLTEFLSTTISNSKVSGQVQEIRNIRIALDCLNILKFGDKDKVDGVEEYLPETFDSYLKDKTYLQIMISDLKKEVARFEKSADVWNSRSKTAISKPKNLLQKRARPQKSKSDSEEKPKKKRDLKSDNKADEKVAREKKVIKYKEDESSSDCPDVPAAKQVRAKKTTKKPSQEGGEKGKVIVWSEAEHATYLKAIKKCGKNWKKIAEMVGSRTQLQCQSHTAGFKVKCKKDPSTPGAEVLKILAGPVSKDDD